MHRTRNPLLIYVGMLTAVLPTTCLFFSINIFFAVPLLVGIGCSVVGCFPMPHATKRFVTSVGLVLCFAAALGPFVLFAYAHRSGDPIKIVLPVGYHGEFTIVKDRAKGQQLKLQDGVWVFEIPADGVLLVNDDYPFYMWHQSNCVYSNGRPATVEDLGTTAGRIQTGPGSSKGSWKYDGTEHRWKVVDAPNKAVNPSGGSGGF